jgi:hypothetical protein
MDAPDRFTRGAEVNDGLGNERRGVRFSMETPGGGVGLKQKFVRNGLLR